MLPYTFDCDVYNSNFSDEPIEKLNLTLQLPLTYDELFNEIKLKCRSNETCSETLYALCPNTSVDPFRTFKPRKLIELANEKAKSAYTALEEWLKNERFQNEMMLSNAPCEYRGNAMQQYRKKENIYNEQYNLKKLEIKKIHEEESNQETPDAYLLSIAKAQKRYLDTVLVKTRERKIQIEMRKLRLTQDEEKIKKEALNRLNKSSRV